MNASPSNMWQPLSAAQRGRWLLYQINPQAQGTHNNIFGARVHGNLRPEKVEAALQRLIARHAILRTSFRQGDAAPQQMVAPDATFRISCTDVRGLAPDALRARVMHDAAQPFDLAQAPLMRACMYQGEQDETVLMLAFDHLVIDGWSFWLVLQELGQLLEGSEPAPHAGAA
jgi:hypothetical protein